MSIIYNLQINFKLFLEKLKNYLNCFYFLEYIFAKNDFVSVSDFQKVFLFTWLPPSDSLIGVRNAEEVDLVVLRFM